MIMQAFLCICLVLCLHAISGFDAAAATASEGSDVPRLLFVFGDSYADTGIAPPNKTVAWQVPYGISWPGSPSGRFSDGFVKTDALVSALGLPSPTPYTRLSLNSTVPGSVNFAVAGSGVTFAFGTPPLQVQVGWFAGLVQAGLFSQEALNNAIFFVSVAGNDYAAYTGSTIEGYLDLTHLVPHRIDLNLRTLYSLGARNFMVSSLAPVACLPSRTFPSGFAECEKNITVNMVTGNHNHFLGKRLENITRNLNDSSILFLQQTKAMKYVLEHLSDFGLTEGLKPCCIGQCGLVDKASGKPFFTVCDVPDQHFFWDGVHPTQAGWKAVVDLYTNHYHFTRFSRSLRDWVDALSS